MRRATKAWAGIAAVALVAATVATSDAAPLKSPRALPGPCTTLDVGDAAVAVSDETRDRLGLDGWPDGGMGLLKNDDGSLRFLAPAAFGGPGDRPQVNTITSGTPDNPVAGGVVSKELVDNVPPGYIWYGGGPVYKDPGSGIILQTLHLERGLAGGGFYSELHLGRFDPASGRTTYLGPLAQPDVDFEVANQHNWTSDMGISTLTSIDGYLHVYFPDHRTNADGTAFGATGLSTARAPIAEVIEAAKNGTTIEWKKYHNGGWESPAFGGPSTDLQPDAPMAWAPHVVRSSKGGVIMVAAVSPRQIVLSSSANGLTDWSPRVRLVDDPDRYNAYASIVGIDQDPSVVGDRFFLYHLQWESPEPNWDKARVMRREITCTS